MQSMAPLLRTWMVLIYAGVLLQESHCAGDDASRSLRGLSDSPKTGTWMKTKDGVVCFGDSVIETIQSNWVGDQARWRTIEDVVASYSTSAWRSFGPTCDIEPIKTKDGVACFTHRGKEIFEANMGAWQPRFIATLPTSFWVDGWKPDNYPHQNPPPPGEVVECGAHIKHKTWDGVACFTQRGIDMIASDLVGQTPRWKTVEDVISSTPTTWFLMYSSDEKLKGEVTDVV